MPDPIKAMEMMNQLNLDYGDQPEVKSRAPKNEDPETKRKFDEKLEDARTEREAQKALKKIEFNKARAEVSDIAAKEKANKVEANEYKKYPASTRPAGGGGSAGGDRKALKPAYKAGGKVSSASKRADGCATKGKTRGRII